MLRTISFAAPVCLLVACSHGSSLSDNELAVSSYNAPILELNSPSGGDWLAAGQTTVTGRALNVTDVTVNGVAAEHDGDTFSADVELPRGITLLELRGTDERGDSRYIRESVIAGEFGDPGRIVDDALGLRLNRSGIDFALDTVEDMLYDLDLPSQVVGFPVYQDAYGILGWNAVEVSATIGDIYFSKIELDGDPQEGKLNLTVEIPDLDIWIPVTGSIIGFDFDTDAWMWASRAEINADLLVGVTPAGKLDVQMADPRVDLFGFGYDTSLIPGEVETWILVDTIRGFIEDKLVDEVTTQVPPLLEEQLKGLDLSFETELLERQVQIAATFNRATVDPKGLALGTDIDVHIPGNTGLSYAGYLAIPDGVDAMVNRSSDVAMAVSDDLFNRLLFEVWRAGILELTLSTEDESLDPALLASFGGHEGSIEVSAGLPPVIVQSDGALKLQTGELEVRINTPGGDKGEFLDLSVGLAADADLQVVHGMLTIDLDDADFSVIVRDSDWGAASNEAITRLLEESLPIDTLLGVVADLEVPVPAIAGIEISQASIDRDDAGFHTGVEITLQ